MSSVKRVLLVEDEPLIAMSVTRALRTFGLEVLFALSATDAKALMNSERFDVVLCDLSLPPETGFEVLEALQQRELRTPVVLFSGKVDLDLKSIQATYRHVVGAVIKPCSVDTLVATLNRAIADVA